MQADLFRSYPIRAAVREVWRKKEPLTVSQWAQKYRRVTLGGHVGPWRNDITPYLAFVMDTWGLAYVREVVVCKSPQTGGTEMMFNCLAKSADYDPSTTVVVMQDQSKAREWAKDRIIPMIKESPRLKRLLTDNTDDLASERILLNNGERIYMAWSNSTGPLSGRSVKRVFFDECDKYPATIGKESDPISLGEKRVRTFPYTHKLTKVSTPTTEDGPIWKAFKRCDVEYHYHVSCPDCGHDQVMRLDNLDYPKETLPEYIEREVLARYACEGCGVLWTDRARDRAVRLGRWRRVRGKDVKRPRRVGFHLPSWISPDVPLSEIAAAYLTSKKDRAKLIDFYNAYLAEPFIEELSDRKDDEILKLRDDRHRGIVPRDASCLLMIVDTQQRGFYYEVRALGWGPDLESWQVREGFVESFKALEDVLYNSEYRDADGREYVIQAGFIDSGGGTGTVPKHSRTAEVYGWCRRNPTMRPLKGRRTMTSTYTTSKIDFFPGTKKHIPGGLMLYLINVTYFKDFLTRKLAINPEDPGAWHLHEECPEEYARHMTAEYKNDKGFWECPRGKDNHYWDIGVYFLAAAEILQVKFWKRPGEENTETKAEKPSDKTNRKGRRW